ncbi:MAG: dihydroxyacetone kinase family protein [Thermomicrobiales bacterium]|nr:dihydroxyacetone kinase family protein [Thermomicrobiales bacterium]
MTRMLNEATAFREEMIDGYVTAYSRLLRRVPGASGVIANDAPAPGKVGVVVGGGSGHYPAFYGLVGEGMASAAVIGDVFTSPSGEQAYRVGKTANGGAGVLFTFGNYSGDVMNFGMAETRLRAEGIDARTVLVTDDVLSAPPAEADRRRGIAGGFYVFKSAGASAARGDDLATVEELTRRTNARVRSAGIAFGGCTIPGQSEPLFTVEPGRMEVGLGIHGEPGVRVQERVPAREIAHILVDALLAEIPAGAGGEVAVLVNGLGGAKYEELFVLYSGIAPLLDVAGLHVYEAQIGEFVTSLDMNGCSLTLLWLDDELKRLHDATAETPAYTRIGPDVAHAHRAAAGVASAGAVTSATSETEEIAVVGGAAGAAARAALARAMAALAAIEDDLGRLDAKAGDGDHGAGMARGFRAANAAVTDFTGNARQSFVRGGAAFQDAAGGASGALVGAFLIAVGSSLPADDTEIDASAYARAVGAGLATIQQLGGAQAGDKTMIDALAPFAAALEVAAERNPDLAAAWRQALPAAEAGTRATSEMVSKRGRASRLGERSRGFPDPGATSLTAVLTAFGEAFGTEE